MGHLLLGIVAIVATLAGVHGARLVTSQSSAAPPEAASEKMEIVKLDAVSVPIIRRGNVQGYAIVHAALTVPSGEVKTAKQLLTTFGSEAVIRAFHEEKSIDFTAMQPAQTVVLAERIVGYANARIGRDAVKQAAIEGLSFVEKGDERKRHDR